jgi:hypothetical protein
MAKNVKKISWRQVALIVGAGFAWTKLGLGTAVKEIGVWPKPPSRQEAGYLTQAEWEAKGYGFGSTDYEEWLRGQ